MAACMTAISTTAISTAWSRIDYWRDALGRSDVETGFLDDGRSYNSDLDNGDAFTWVRIDNWADSLGRLDYQNGVYDADDRAGPAGPGRSTTIRPTSSPGRASNASGMPQGPAIRNFFLIARRVRARLLVGNRRATKMSASEGASKNVTPE